MKLYCCGCEKEVKVRLTDGVEIYPHRNDLKDLPFWKCDKCNNFVGCHHKTKNRTRPLGVIPTAELRNARQHIHKRLDPLWRFKKIKRNDLYKQLSLMLGKEYHTSHIKTIDEARKVYKFIVIIEKDLNDSVPF